MEATDESKKFLPHEFNIWRVLAIVFYLTALGIDIFRFVFLFVENAFNYQELAILVFDIVFGFFIILGLFKRNFALIDLILIILKVYDGVYFILYALRSLDGGHIDVLDQVSSYFIIAAGVMSLVTLFFFCLHYYFGEKKFWHLIEISIIVTAGLLLVASILSIIDGFTSEIGWPLFIETVYMCLQTFAVFFICRYVRDYE